MYYILTEGGGSKGYGHIGRCTALYRALVRRGNEVKFLIDGEFSSRVMDSPAERFNWKSNLVDITKGDTVIIDSYEASWELCCEYSNAAKKCVWLDDYNRINYPGGIVVNGNVYGKDIKYKQAEQSLLGLEHFLLREEFWSARKDEIISPDIKSVLISVGNRDVSRRVYNSLCGDLEIFIIGGGQSPEGLPSSSYWFDKVTAGEMAFLMNKVDLAVTAAGQTVAELAFIGTPTVSISMVENQNDNFEGWKRTGFIEPLEKWSHSAFKAAFASLQGVEERNKKRVIGQACVDGDGVGRLLKKI